MFYLFKRAERSLFFLWALISLINTSLGSFESIAQEDEPQTVFEQAYILVESKDAHALSAFLHLHQDVVKQSNDEGSTLLYFVTSCAIAQLLLRKGAEATCCNKQQDTPLHYISENTDCDEAVLEMLLQEGALVNARNEIGETALSIAANCHKANLLINAGAVIDETMMVAAAQQDRWDVVNELISTGFSRESHNEVLKLCINSYGLQINQDPLARDMYIPKATRAVCECVARNLINRLATIDDSVHRTLVILLPNWRAERKKALKIVGEILLNYSELPTALNKLIEGML